MIEVFRTNVQDTGQSGDLLKKLESDLPGGRLNFDLEDRDRILRVECEDFSAQTVIQLLNENGYWCEVLED